MRFYEDRVEFSDSEKGAAFLIVVVGVLLSFISYGITLAIAVVGLYGYYYWEREQDRRVQRQIEELWHELESTRKEIQLLQSFDFYLTTPKKKAIKKPLEQAIMELVRIPEKYSHRVEPVKEKVDSHLTFLSRYNEFYINHQKTRHAGFFNGQDYHDGCPFNDEQARAILTNDINNLIIAGPGAGKTRALTARAAFFVRRKNVAPSEILILAYNKRAVNEVKSRLKERFEIGDAKVTTFHSLGSSILRRLNKTKRRIKVESHGEQVIKTIVNDLVESDRRFQAEYLSYVADWKRPDDSSVDEPEIMDERFRLRLHEAYRALDGTNVKSLAERDIANFFIQHGVSYLYESEVEWCDKDLADPEREYHPDFYLPEHDIYLEHWAVSSDSRPPDFFTPEETRRYLGTMCWKRSQFRKHGKTLWETNHTLFKEGRLETTLGEYFADLGIELQRLAYSELLRRIGLRSQEDQSVRETIADAIKTAKVYGLSPESLAWHVESSSADNKKERKQRQFIIDIVLKVFERYQSHLQERESIDFEDMINHAVDTLETKGTVELNSAGFGPYKQILVDEFQDISHQRLSLLTALQRLNPDSRLFCVGDDWQAIYGFAGASTRHMIRFESSRPSLARVDLVQNYRNPCDILDFSTETIDRCSEKIAKTLLPREVDAREASDDILVFKRVHGVNQYDFRSRQNEAALTLIKDLTECGVKPEEILVLSRFNLGYGDLRRDCIDRSIPVELFRDGRVNVPGVRFMTVHRSKGLEAEYVILLNVFEGTFGFPSEIKSKLDFTIINPDMPDSLDEERRLFFVAATRAKKKCIVFAWAEHESKFLTENEHFLTHYHVPDEPVLRGRILEERDRSYVVEVHFSPSFRPSLWMAKNQVVVEPIEDYQDIQSFELTEWMHEKVKKQLEKHIPSFS